VKRLLWLSVHEDGEVSRRISFGEDGGICLISLETLVQCLRAGDLLLFCFT
jgi:hypothetical protein